MAVRGDTAWPRCDSLLSPAHESSPSSPTNFFMTKQTPLNVLITKLPHGEHLPLPAYATEGAAAVDLYAAIPKAVTLQSLERTLVPTGIAIALPAGYEAQIRPRSGLALKHGITFPNTPGTIDADYRGEIGVIVANISKEPFTIEPGDRIAQMVVARHEVVAWQQVEELPASTRKSGGFGSTGKK